MFPFTMLNNQYVFCPVSKVVCNTSSLFPFQDLSCIDDLSTNSLFSSPNDSLSEYADAQSFISTDNLDTVPTLWDINTSTTAAPAQSQLEVSSETSQAHAIPRNAAYHSDRLIVTCQLLRCTDVPAHFALLMLGGSL